MSTPQSSFKSTRILPKPGKFMKNNNPVRHTSQANPQDFRKFRLGEISSFKEAPKEQLIAVIEDASPADRAFLNGIVHFDNNFEAVYPSQSTLGNRWGYDARTMRRSARKMHKQGIVRKYKHESQESCYYMVNKYLRDYSVRERLKKLIPALKFFHLSWLLPIAMTSWSPESSISPLHYSGRRAPYTLNSYRKGEPYIPQRNALCGDWNNCIIEMVLVHKNNNARNGQSQLERYQERWRDYEFKRNRGLSFGAQPRPLNSSGGLMQGDSLSTTGRTVPFHVFKGWLEGNSSATPEVRPATPPSLSAMAGTAEVLRPNVAPPDSRAFEERPLSTLFSNVLGRKRPAAAGAKASLRQGFDSQELRRTGRALSSYCEGETVLPDHIRQQDVHDIIPHYICELRNLKLTLAGAVELTCFPKEALQYADAALNRASPSDPFKYFCKIASSYCKENNLRPDYSRRESLIGDLKILPDAPRLLSATEERRIKDEKRTREVEKTLMGSQSDKDAAHWANELKTNSQLKANLAKLGLGDEFNPFTPKATSD